MNKDTMIKVVNRCTGRVGYYIPELRVNRQFAARETKEISFGELEALSFIPGGMPILKNYLVIRNEEALKELGLEVQPEYYYTEEDIKKLLETGTLDEFLDCLDFAPEGTIDIVKKIAVDLPLDNVSKREALLNKTGFDVAGVIRVKNTKYDGESADAGEETKTESRRAATPVVKKESEAPQRRTAPKYKIAAIKE